MPRRKSDLELIAELKKGNEASFEELIQRYSGKAFALASRLTRSQEDAEEVLQDVFVTVYRKIGGFEGKSSFSSWLYRVTVNAAFMKLRKRRRELTQLADDTAKLTGDEHHDMSTTEIVELDRLMMRKEMLTALESAIQKLPDEYRPVFVLREVDGLTSREVGKILNISVPAVKSRLHRSRMMIRRKMQPFFRDSGKNRLPDAGNM